MQVFVWIHVSVFLGWGPGSGLLPSRVVVFSLTFEELPNSFPEFLPELWHELISIWNNLEASTHLFSSLKKGVINYLWCSSVLGMEWWMLSTWAWRRVWVAWERGSPGGGCWARGALESGCLLWNLPITYLPWPLKWCQLSIASDPVKRAGRETKVPPWAQDPGASLLCLHPPFLGSTWL